eukprot:2230816-Prymnesium_polylepis.1
MCWFLGSAASALVNWSRLSFLATSVCVTTPIRMSICLASVFSRVRADLILISGELRRATSKRARHRVRQEVRATRGWAQRTAEAMPRAWSDGRGILCVAVARPGARGAVVRCGAVRWCGAVRCGAVRCGA